MWVKVFYPIKNRNSLPNDKIMNQSDFKAFAIKKMKVTPPPPPPPQKKKKKKSVENIVLKGENTGYQHFLYFPQCFLKLSFPEVLKVGIV